MNYRQELKELIAYHLACTDEIAEEAIKVCETHQLIGVRGSIVDFIKGIEHMNRKEYFQNLYNNLSEKRRIRRLNERP